MADLSTPAKPILGIEKIFQDTYRIFLSKYILFTLLSFMPFLFIGFGFFATGFVVDDIQNIGQGSSAPSIVLLFIILLYLAATMFSFGLIANYVSDMMTGVAPKLSRYVSPCLRLSPIALLLLVVIFLAVAVGMFFLIFPGFYLGLVLAIVMPAVYLEGRGFSALGRSSNLTRGYRWWVFCAMLITYIPAVLVYYIVSVIVLILTGVIIGSGSDSSIIVGVLLAPLYLVGGAVFAAVYYIVTTMIFLRLKQIKEGFNMSDVSDVFS